VTEPRTLRIALAQINSTVGDLEGNTTRILRAVDDARAHGADLVAFPEMAVPGYPVEDLLLKPQFVNDNLARLHQIVAHCTGITAVVGFIDRAADIYNAAAVIHDGRLVGVYHKQYLPNYGVFDENRHFQAGSETPVFEVGGIRLGVNVCEDMWYPTGPTALQALAGAEVIVNINASPYHREKWQFRERMVGTRASDHGVIIACVNLVGGQDELVFDGGSFIVDENGEVLARAGRFQEDLLLADLDVEGVFRRRVHLPLRRKERLLDQSTEQTQQHFVSGWASRPTKPALPARTWQPPDPVGDVYDALVLGLHDYVQKTGFSKVALGLSGGIDSSLVACLAVDALGKANVIGVAMPSRYSSEGSIIDARVLAEKLDIAFHVVPIEEVFTSYLAVLDPVFAGAPPNVAEENLQARIRGTHLMTLSNKFGWLILTTGNKSETAVGYSTLYGDMAGGFAVIKDVPKTLVYELCRYRNAAIGQAVPEDVFTKPPSAELRPNQTDQDSLPPYDLLDQIIEAYVEEDRSYDELLLMGFPAETVQRVIRLIDVNEYKRRQAAPGIKITPRAFGRDRRMPIANRYRAF